MKGGEKHCIVSLAGKTTVVRDGVVTCQCGWTRPYPTIWVAFAMHDVHVLRVLFAGELATKGGFAGELATKGGN